MFEKIARRSGIDIRGAHNWTIADNRHAEGIRDAYVLCMTTRSDDEAMAKFGPHCVQIRSPKEVNFRLILATQAERAMQLHLVGLVDYRAREYAGLEPEPGPLGFVKPECYATEQEARFLFVPAEFDQPIHPRLFECGNLRDACVRVQR